MNRFSQIAEAYLHQFPGNTTLESITANVKTIMAMDLPMLTLILQQLPKKLALSQMGLLIVDSIAAPFQGDAIPGRRKTIISLARELKALAHKHNLVIVCINQVSEVIRTQALHAPEPVAPTPELNGLQLPPGVKLTLGGQANDPNRLAYQPALGLVWSNLINARILVSRCQAGTLPDGDDISAAFPNPPQNFGSLRKLVTLTCPWAVPASALFHITSEGLRDAEPRA